MLMAGKRTGVGALVATLVLVAGFATAGLAAPAKRSESTPWLGVMTQELSSNPELREGVGYDGDGVLVARVVPGSPADRAGIRKGDILTTLNSRTIGSPEELADMVHAGRVGQQVSIGLVRDGHTNTVTVRLNERASGEGNEVEAPEAPEPPEPPTPGEAPRADRHVMRWQGNLDDLKDVRGLDLPDMAMMGGRGRLGIRVQSLEGDLGEYFRTPGGKGALVLQVLKDTPAEKAGLKAGDVITKVDGKSVEDGDDLVGALRAADRHVTLTVVRRGETRTVESDLDAPARGHTMRMPGGGGSDDGDRRVIVRRFKAPSNDLGEGNTERRVIIRHPGDDGPDADELRGQIQDLRKQLDDLKAQLRELQKR